MCHPRIQFVCRITPPQPLSSPWAFAIYVFNYLFIYVGRQTESNLKGSWTTSRLLHKPMNWFLVGEMIVVSSVLSVALVWCGSLHTCSSAVGQRPVLSLNSECSVRLLDLVCGDWLLVLACMCERETQRKSMCVHTSHELFVCLSLVGKCSVEDSHWMQLFLFFCAPETPKQNY